MALIDTWSLNERWVNSLLPDNRTAQIGDETADGIYHPTEFSPLRILMRAASIFPSHGCAIIPDASWTFSAVRLVYQLHTLCGEFVRWGCSQILDPDSPYIALLVLAGTGSPPKPKRQKKPFRPCMEKTSDASMAFNYRRWSGITLVNIGVGPSNAKTICDHWQCYARMSGWWLVTVADYVKSGHWRLCTCTRLFTRWPRSDAVLPPDIPIPSIAEVQRALMTPPSWWAAGPVRKSNSGYDWYCGNHRWQELGITLLSFCLRFNLSRAVAIDMESATIAAKDIVSACHTGHYCVFQINRSWRD